MWLEVFDQAVLGFPGLLVDHFFAAQKHDKLYKIEYSMLSNAVCSDNGAIWIYAHWMVLTALFLSVCCFLVKRTPVFDGDMLFLSHF